MRAVHAALVTLAFRSPRLRPSRRHPVPVFAALAAVVLAFAAGCSSSRTSAPSVALVNRAVTVLVADSLGTPAAGVLVRAIAMADSGGFGALTTGTTDGDGAVRFASLSEGAWAFTCASGAAPGRAAGATAIVPGASRPAEDTLVVRLTLHTASSANVRRTLSDAADPDGTIVQVVETGALAFTDADGECTLHSLPVGRWTLASVRYGYATHYAPFEVGAPGSEIVLPTIALRWLDLPPDTGSGHH